MLTGEDDDAYTKRQSERNLDFFNKITTDLNEKGGMILFVQGGGVRMDKGVYAKHFQALKEVLGNDTFCSKVVLVLTHLPETSLAGDSWLEGGEVDNFMSGRIKKIQVTMTGYLLCM